MTIAVQYWSGDEAQALALARLLHDVTPKERKDVYLVLARRGDCPWSEEAAATQRHCGQKLSVLVLQSDRPERGHPDGCHGLWAGTVMKLHRLWRRGNLPWSAGRTVVMAEADCAPLRPDWATRLEEAHARTLTQGLRVTGAVMDVPMPHVNGVFILALNLLDDYPSLLTCPPGVAWDLHHAEVLIRECRSSYVIRNEYNTRDWTAGALNPIGRESAIIHGVKDDSVLTWARAMARTLWR